MNMARERLLAFNEICLKVLGMCPIGKEKKVTYKILYYVRVVFLFLLQLSVTYFTLAEVLFTDKELVNASINILTSGNYFNIR